MVIFISQSEKKAVLTVRKILDSFADRIGDDAWQAVITEAGLLAVKTALRRNATKSMAVSCRWIRSRSRSDLLWIVGNRNSSMQRGLYPSIGRRKMYLTLNGRISGSTCLSLRLWQLWLRFSMTGERQMTIFRIS